MKNLIITILAMIVATSSIIAQENEEANQNENTVIVYLKTGTAIEGEINDWVIGDYIDIKTAWRESIVLPDDVIDKVIQKSTLKIRANHAYRFKESGTYYSIKGQLISGNAGGRARNVNGLGMSASMGKRFSRLMSIGAGLGYDRFIWDSGENLIPVFAELSSFFTPNNTSIFANLQAGYSFAFKDDTYLISEAKGGLLVYPAIGIRFGRYDTKYTFDFGYKFQKAQFTYRDAWSADRREQRLTYKRLTLRFGILL